MATKAKTVQVLHSDSDYVRVHGHVPRSKERGMWAFRCPAMSDLIWVSGTYAVARKLAAAQVKTALAGIAAEAHLLVQP